MMAGFSCLGEEFLIAAWLSPPVKKNKNSKQCMYLEVTQGLSFRKVPPDAFSEFSVPQNAVTSSIG